MACNLLVAAIVWLHILPGVNDVFSAMDDASRRQLLDQLYKTNGLTLKELCRNLKMSRQAVTKHLAKLQDANLVVHLWKGREKRHYLNPVPLKEISEQWMYKYAQGCLRALAELQRGLDEN